MVFNDQPPLSTDDEDEELGVLERLLGAIELAALERDELLGAMELATLERDELLSAMELATLERDELTAELVALPHKAPVNTGTSAAAAPLLP